MDKAWEGKGMVWGDCVLRVNSAREIGYRFGREGKGISGGILC